VLDLRLRLPRAVPAGAWLSARTVRLNGVRWRGRRVALAALKLDATNTLEVELRVAGSGAPAPPLLAVAEPHGLSAAERARLYAPAAPPPPAGTRRGAIVSLRLPAPEAGTTLALYRDGEAVGARRVAATVEDRLGDGAATACYLLVAHRTSTGLASLPSRELCLVDAATSVRVLPGDAAVEAFADGGEPATGGGAFTDWGTPGARITIAFTARAAGLQRLRIEYENSSGPVNTGITAAVKRVQVGCSRTRRPQRGAIVMPHLPPGSSGLSSALLFEAHAAERCVLTLVDGFNMSYLAHFALYTGGAGGEQGAQNRATLKAFDFDYAGRVRAHAPAEAADGATLTAAHPSVDPGGRRRGRAGA
jgi:hypothetical protein